MAEENINNEVVAEDAVIDAASQEVAEELTADIAVDSIEVEVTPAAVSNPVQTVGRRKEAVVRVRMVPGTGQFVLNGRTLENYFPNKVHQQLVKSPLVLVEREEQFDIQANLRGGGPSGQAGALRLAIARALNVANPDDRPALKKAGFLTRDSRAVERKKAGLHKARRAPQYSKR
ncbi:30S ribosomal protein S9 [Lawsonella clevelandensis]|uniref:Small ribosomal subunit protein uS9 n=1 Tax=Lawsonella clevelandensis TaxID=1528099 RepID=A0A5E3ZX84_9ACTN|nr:30S ribosomal protein S9 [Lawsonella clevelandensis]MDU7193750.1 30S ribosomal protein S9 [Lawsonella clevelandensis]VHO00183.1 30S ribosomal protein S9 [Lawsonella clevelandensis]